MKMSSIGSSSGHLFLVSDTVYKCCSTAGGSALVDEVRHWRKTLRFYSMGPLPVCSVSYLSMKLALSAADQPHAPVARPSLP